MKISQKKRVLPAGGSSVGGHWRIKLLVGAAGFPFRFVLGEAHV